MTLDTIPSIRRLSAGLTTMQRIDYLLLGLMSVALVCDWSWALVVMYAMTGWAVVRRIMEGCRHVRDKRLSLWLMMLYAALYWVSLLYTSNMEEGIAVAMKKLSFVLVPLYFILSDHGYLDRSRMRGLLWLFVIALCVRFEVRLVIAIVKGLQGGFRSYLFFGGMFDTFHHSYLSMYILLAMVFLYSELRRSRFHLSRIGRWLMVDAMVELTLYLMMIQSRAGVLMFILLMLYVLVDVSVVQRHYRAGVAVLASAIAIGVVCVVWLPQANRLGDTVREVVEGNRDDVRFAITETAWTAIGDNMPWGVGAGDRFDVMEHYFGLTCPHKKGMEFNPHNQYNDALLATGIVGLLLLLALFVVPMVQGRRLHHQARMLLYGLVMIVACSCLFESIFERQMGLLFYAFFVGLTTEKGRSLPSL